MGEVVVPPSGPPDARIMLVGEAPGKDEVEQLRPFVGASGWQLDSMLHDAKILRTHCFITNVVRTRPPENDINTCFAKAKKDITPAHTEYKGRWVTNEVLVGARLLADELRRGRPDMVIALGATPLWALTGLEGITKWRGSMLHTDGAGEVPGGIKVIPTFHPASILRQWKQRATAVQDIRRAARYASPADYPEPRWNFQIRPTHAQADACLALLHDRVDRGPLTLAFDIETARQRIACVGIAWSRTDAICIPFIHEVGDTRYWGDREAEIIASLRRLLTHPNARVIGQNLLYDCQYTARWWGFVPNVTQDTMVNQHALYSSLPKSLAFLASLYCDYYVWWKGESKDFYEGEKTTTPEIEDRLWSYNCKDCVYTYEVAEVLARITTHSGMSRVFEAQQSMFTPVLQAMRRGVLIDRERRDAMIAEVRAALTERENFLEMAAGHPLNFDSHKQLTAFFYTDLGLPVQMTRAGKGEAGRPTLDDEALTRLGQLEPCVKPLTNAVADCRTLEKLLSNFLLRELSTDGRMRCSFNIAGTYTYRMSSSADAFGHGTNLQTIPSETTKSAAKAAARGSLLGAFPNIRDIFVPDRGHIWFDLDLQRADLFVVVYEADDHDLKAAMRLGVDMHLLSAFTLLNKEPPPYDELIERHTESDTCSCHGTCYWEHRAKFKHTRQLAKTLIHGTNYCGRPRTMSAHTGRTVAEVERLQRTWFGAHPGIERWHKRVHREITQRRYVENRLGYRWHIFDRADAVLPEAVAWIPQSTVGLVINHIWRRLTALPDVEVLLQVHDSLAGQLPASYAETLLPRIIELSQITVPYDDPLVIPVSIKTSSRSWGDC